MKTIVINTSKEAKNTKLDILFKAPFDRNSLLWLESELTGLGENADRIKQSLLEDTDTIDRDYQLIVLVDLYPFPLGNDRQVVAMYQKLMEKYISFSLVERLYDQLNLAPMGVALYFVDSAKEVRGLDMDALAANTKEQEALERAADAKREKQQRKTGLSDNGDLVDDEDIPAGKKSEDTPTRTPEQRIVMDIFGWTEQTGQHDFPWKVKISVTDDEYLDFAEVFADTSYSIRKDDPSAAVLESALKGVLDPLESSRLLGVGRFPVYSHVCYVARDNEQSKIEGFFGVFANIFTCVQEKKLLPEWICLDKEQIRLLLIAALKKYKYFSAEEHIQLRFEPITKVFELRKTICEKRKKDARARSEFKDKSDEEVAQIVMSEKKPAQVDCAKKLRGLDLNFHQLAAEIFNNYDEDVIRAQNNRIVKSCLEGLWDWRDKQNADIFRCIVDEAITAAGGAPASSLEQRDTLEFIQEDYEAKRDALIDQVTDAEHRLAANQNILLDTKDLVLAYGDWMRKGRWSWISFIGAIFTVLATVFPFFYTEYCAGNTGLGFHVNLWLIIGFCAFLYAVAASVYIGYINRRKQQLLWDLDKIRSKSEDERKKSIIALYRYYNDTVVEAESYELLWREILRRDRENAKKGVKRNYHIKRLKGLSQQVERFITMLKIDAGQSLTADQKDIAAYGRMGLQLNGEESYYEEQNRRVYCFLPENNLTELGKGETEEA